MVHSWLALFVGAYALSSVIAKVQLEWEISTTEDMSGDRPPALRGSTAVRIKNGVYVFGGWDGHKMKDDVWKLESGTWSVVQSKGTWKPPARERHAAAVVGNNMFVYGGELTHIGAMDAFDAFDAETVEWRHVKGGGNKPPPLSRHTLTAIGTSLYLFGGRSGLGHVSEHLYLFDTLTGTWQLLVTNGLSPHRRSSHAAAAVGTNLYILGGSVSLLLDKPYDDLHVFDTVKGEWRTLIPLQTRFPPLEGHSACVFGRQIVWFGGHDGHKPRSDVFVLDTQTRRVSRPVVGGPHPEGRVLAAVAPLPSRMLLLGGVMELEDSLDFFGDIYTLKITRVPDLEEGSDDNEDESPGDMHFNGHDKQLDLSAALATGAQLSDDQLAKIYKHQHPERASMVDKAMAWEHQFENATKTLQETQQSMAMEDAQNVVPYGAQARGQLAGSVPTMDLPASNSAEAFQRGMEMGLEVESLLQDSELSGSLTDMFNKEKMKERRKRPEIVEARRELAEAFQRFQHRLETDHSLMQELDKALREAEEGLSQKATTDAALLKQAQQALIAQSNGNEEAAKPKLEMLQKSELAVNAYKEGVLARVAHMLRLLDNPTSANMLMQAINAMPQQQQQQQQEDPSMFAGAQQGMQMPPDMQMSQPQAFEG